MFIIRKVWKHWFNPRSWFYKETEAQGRGSPFPPTHPMFVKHLPLEGYAERFGTVHCYARPVELQRGTAFQASSLAILVKILHVLIFWCCNSRWKQNFLNCHPDHLHQKHLLRMWISPSHFSWVNHNLWEWDPAICISNKVTERLTRFYWSCEKCCPYECESQSPRGGDIQAEGQSPWYGMWDFPRRVRKVCAWKGSKTSSTEMVSLWRCRPAWGVRARADESFERVGCPGVGCGSLSGVRRAPAQQSGPALGAGAHRG